MKIQSPNGDKMATYIMSPFCFMVAVTYQPEPIDVKH